MSVSAEFNETFYLTNNADVVVAISQGFFSSALQHYNLFGGKELRAPNSTFDPNYYAVNNPDVLNAVATGVFSNVFEHYKAFGESENRAPTSVYANFDAEGYLAANADVAAAVTAGSFASALDHFIAFGQAEARSGSGVTAGAGTTGSSFALTSGIDNLVGTTGNDTFTGEDNLVSAGDSVDGGSGTDTLRIFDIGGTVALPQTTSIENVYVNALANNLDFSSRTEITGIETDGQVGGNLTIGAGQTVTFDSLNAAGTTNLASASSVTSVSIVADGITAGETIDLTGTGVATLDVNANGDASTVAIANTGANLRTMNVTGSANFDTDQAALANVTTVNASTATGNIAVLADAVNLTYTGGSGVDTVTIAGTEYSTSDVLDGGAGDGDILAMDDGDVAFTSDQTNISNFEILRIQSALAGSNTVEADHVGVNKVELFANASAAGAINGLTSGATLILGTAVLDVGDTLLDINLSDAAGSGDVLNIDHNSTTAGTSDLDMDVTGIETINIDSSGSDQDAIFTFTGAQVSSMTVLAGTGASDDVVIGFAAGGTIVADVDASGTTGSGGLQFVGVASAVQGASITGTKNADAITGSSADDVISTGAGVDTITVSRGVDTVTGGAGNDSFLATAISANATVATDRMVITDFDAGTSSTAGDTLTLDLSNLNALEDDGAFGADLVNFVEGDGSALTTGNATLNTQVISTDGSTGTATTEIFLIDIGTYADDAAITTAFGAGSLTFSTGTVVDNDGVLIAYKTTAGNINIAGAQFNGTGGSSDSIDAVQTLVTLNGITTYGNFNATDFLIQA